jgi:myosin heavy subunit
MVLVAHRDVGNAKDADGNTPMDLAVEGDYPERDAVVAALNRWLANNITSPSNNSVGGNSNAKRENSPRKMIVSAPTGTTVTTSSTMHSSGSVPSPYISVVKEEKKEPDARGTISNRSASPIRNMSPVRGRSASPALRVETSTSTPRGMSSLETGSLGSYHDTNAMGGYTSRGVVDAVSPRTVNRLRMEIAKLKQDQKAKEEKWDEQLSLSKESWKMQVSQLEDRLADQKEELEQLTAQLEESKRDGMDKLEALEQAHNQIGQLEHELNATQEERDGLRMTLADLTEQHDLYKKKSEHMNDRLGSLSASLQSMMSEQQKVVNGMREREATIQHSTKLRKDRLKELLKQEDELESVFVQNDDLRAAVEKQSREMDAIAAVIAVARQ